MKHETVFSQTQCEECDRTEHLKKAWNKIVTKAICWPKTGTNLVIMGDLLIGGSMDKRGSMVDSVVSNWG